LWFVVFCSSVVGGPWSFVGGLSFFVGGRSSVVVFQIFLLPIPPATASPSQSQGGPVPVATVVRNVPKNKSRLPVRNPPVSGQYYPAAGSTNAASPDAVLCFCSFLTLRYKGKMLVSSCVSSTGVKIRAVGIRANAGF
jgi:hypothetical protein